MMPKNTGSGLNKKSGLSLIEILVVVTIFTILSVITTRIIILTLQGSKKSEGVIAVRENLDYTMSVIERQIRNANSVDCDNSTIHELYYTDATGDASPYFRYDSTQANIASGSASYQHPLTSNDVYIVNCTFTCTTAAASRAYVDVTIEGRAAVLTKTPTIISKSTRIYLRNY